MTKKQRFGPYRLAGRPYRRKDDGRWAFAYYDETNRRRAIDGRCWHCTLRCRRMAERYEHHGGEIETVAQFLDAWMERREKNPRVRTATHANNGTHIEHYIKPHLGALMLGDLRPRVVRNWLCDLRDKPQRSIGKPLAANTVRNIVATLKKALDAAVDEELVASNPVRSGIVRDELPKAEHRHGDTLVCLRRADAELLITSEAVPEQRRVRWLVALTSGLREGELQGLTWADVDLESVIPLLDVHRAFTVRCKTGELKTSNARRKVPLHHHAVRALRAWKSGGWTVLVGRHARPADAVFSNSKGGHTRPRSAEHIRADLAACGCLTEIAGHPVDAHATRRTFATWLAEAEVDEGIRRRLMGHSGASVTDQHYTAKTLARLAEAVERIELDTGRGQVIAVDFAQSSRQG